MVLLRDYRQSLPVIMTLKKVVHLTMFPTAKYFISQHNAFQVVQIPSTLGSSTTHKIGKYEYNHGIN